MTRTYKDWYLRGYEEGLREAWEEVSRMAARGHTSKEIQLYIRSRKASINQSLKKKEVDFAKEIDTSEATPYSHARSAPAPTRENKGAELRNGYSYLIKEEKPDKSYALVTELVSQGHNAICITRTHPAQIRDQYNVDGTRIIWLTKKERGMALPSGIGVPHGSGEEERISPSKLSELGSILYKFLQKNKENGGVILFDGIDYLITQNEGFPPILKFIQYINENVAEHRGVLFVPLGGGFNPEWYSMLKKELTTEV